MHSWNNLSHFVRFWGDWAVLTLPAAHRIYLFVKKSLIILDSYGFSFRVVIVIVAAYRAVCVGKPEWTSERHSRKNCLCWSHAQLDKGVYPCRCSVSTMHSLCCSSYLLSLYVSDHCFSILCWSVVFNWDLLYKTGKNKQIIWTFLLFAFILLLVFYNYREI